MIPVSFFVTFVLSMMSAARGRRLGIIGRIIPIAAVCLLALFFHFAFDDGSAGKEELTIYD